MASLPSNPVLYAKVKNYIYAKYPTHSAYFFGSGYNETRPGCFDTLLSKFLLMDSTLHRSNHRASRLAWMVRHKHSYLFSLYYYISLVQIIKNCIYKCVGTHLFHSTHLYLHCLGHVLQLQTVLWQLHRDYTTCHFPLCNWSSTFGGRIWIILDSRLNLDFF